MPSMRMSAWRLQHGHASMATIPNTGLCCVGIRENIGCQGGRWSPGKPMVAMGTRAKGEEGRTRNASVSGCRQPVKLIRPSKSFSTSTCRTRPRWSGEAYDPTRSPLYQNGALCAQASPLPGACSLVEDLLGYTYRLPCDLPALPADPAHREESTWLGVASIVAGKAARCSYRR